MMLLAIRMRDSSSLMIFNCAVFRLRLPVQLA